MKSLNGNQFKNFKILNLSNIRGGDGKTRYNHPNGTSGTDCYSDDDGDGKLSCGDGVRLDTGVWYTMCE